jgi:hypothetical protein
MYKYPFTSCSTLSARRAATKVVQMRSGAMIFPFLFDLKESNFTQELIF